LREQQVHGCDQREAEERRVGGSEEQAGARSGRARGGGNLAARRERQQRSAGRDEWRGYRGMRQSDYYPITFTAAQWQQLQNAFPTGVCDWTKPGIGQQPTIPWQTYQNADGSVVYGGTPLGPPPAGSGSGWMDGVFRDPTIATPGS
jgi:Tannase-like family of unknown function (DUF6351)